MLSDGEVDWPGVESLISSLVDGGADGIVVTGTTGETSTLTDDEKVELVRVAKRVAAGRAKIITGGPSNETAHAIELIRRSEAAGADAIMLVTPYYLKPTQAGVLTHIRMCADATELPVLLYNIPGRTGVRLSYDTIMRAAQRPNVLAIKDAVGDMAEVTQVLTNSDLLYFSGDDSNILAHVALGATGLISVTANIAPQAYRQIIDATNNNDFHTALTVHNALSPLVRATMTHIPGTVSTKYILHGLGRIGSPRVRLPLVGPEDFEAAQIEADIKSVGALPGVDFSSFRPDRNAAAGGALPKIAGAARTHEL